MLFIFMLFCIGREMKIFYSKSGRFGKFCVKVLKQGFLTRGARNVPRGCGDAESLRLIRPTFLNTKKRYVTDFKFTSGK